MANGIMSGAEMCCIDKKFVVNSLIAWRTVQKNMDLYDCMGFVAPCPDMCSTRRLNKQQFTMCFSHSLNLEQGIGYDTDNCNGGFVFEVEDARKMFHAQMQTGLHLVYTYGDIVDDLKLFAKRAGFEVLAV